MLRRVFILLYYFNVQYHHQHVLCTHTSLQAKKNNFKMQQHVKQL